MCCDGARQIERRQWRQTSATTWSKCTNRAATPKANRVRVSRISCARSITPLSGSCVVRSEEHTSELQSLMRISYAVFCLKKKKIQQAICTYNTDTALTKTIH